VSRESRGWVLPRQEIRNPKVLADRHQIRPDSPELQRGENRSKRARIGERAKTWNRRKQSEQRSSQREEILTAEYAEHAEAAKRLNRR
jgi:hypothetical protein